ncbi:MAG: hypothetical protein JNM36_06555 [Chitinophagales bacterium]|nr:hypothetical protein [Chitinophagales bacterium]
MTNDIIQILLLLFIASLLGALVYWLFNRSRWKVISEEREHYFRKFSETEDKYKLLSTHANQLESTNKDITDQLNLSLSSNNRLSQDLNAWQLKYNGLEKTSADQQNRIAFLEPFQAKAESLALNLKDAEISITNLTNDKNKLTADINQLNALKAKLEKDIADLQAKVGQLNGEIDSQKAMIIGLNGQITGLNGDIDTHKTTINGLNADITARQATIADLEGRLADLNAQIAAQTATINGLNADIAARQATIADLEGRLADLNAQIAAQTATIDGLRGDVTNLQNEKGKLSLDLSNVTNSLSSNEGQLHAANAVQMGLMAQIKDLQNLAVDQDGDLTTLNDRIAELEALANKRADLIAVLNDDMNRLRTQSETDLQSKSAELEAMLLEYNTLEGMYAELQAAHNRQDNNLQEKEGAILLLQTDLEACRAAQQAVVVAPVALTSASDEELDRIKQNRDKLDFDVIGLADENEQDNLQLIKGVGPFIERKLHALSIYTFRQIANFTPEIRDKVNEAIEFFSGRIERENWVPQAVIFAQNQLTDYEKERLTKKAAKLDFAQIGTATPEEAQPLGYAIDGLKELTQVQLNHIGIYTFEQLAKCPLGVLADVLDFTSQRIREERWLEQAAELANKNVG